MTVFQFQTPFHQERRTQIYGISGLVPNWTSAPRSPVAMQWELEHVSVCTVPFTTLLLFTALLIRQ